ncbi:MAG: GNAT family N-acetyltransferase [Myxococcota bacterium]
MGLVTLVRPTVVLRESFLAGLRDFRADGLAWHLAVDLAAVEGDFDAYVRAQLALEKTELWAVVGGEFAGRISVWPFLTPERRVVGGHVGYDTVPRFRGRGVATEMFRQALPVAWGFGLDRVLLTCDDDNVASIRVIEKNGGVLEATRVVDPARTAKRYYWIAKP